MKLDLDFVDNAVNAVGKALDGLFTSDEERMEKQAKIAKVHATLEQVRADLAKSIFSLVSSVVKAQASIINTEAKGESWLQRNWRPLAMLTFVVLVVCHWMGWTAPNLSETQVLSLLDLVKIGLGGYVVSRGVEKGISIWKGQRNH